MTKFGIYFGSKVAELDGWDKGCGEGRRLKDDPPGSWLSNRWLLGHLLQW